jgi:hypothetical protein
VPKVFLQRNWLALSELGCRKPKPCRKKVARKFGRFGENAHLAASSKSKIHQRGNFMKTGIAYQVFNINQLKEAVNYAKSIGIRVHPTFVNTAVISNYLGHEGLCIFRETDNSLTYSRRPYFEKLYYVIVPFWGFSNYIKLL